MTWQRLGKWDPIIIGASVALLFGVWLFLAFGPTECFAFVQTGILGGAAYVGLKTWRLDVEKRYDPVKQDIYRQRIAAYRSLTGAMNGLGRSTDTITEETESFLEARTLLIQCFSRNKVLMHPSVMDNAWSFIDIVNEIDANIEAREAAPVDKNARVKYLKQLDEAFSNCVNAMRVALDIDEADIHLASR